MLAVGLAGAPTEQPRQEINAVPSLVQEINQYLKRKNSPLAPYAKAIVKAGRKWGVSPYLIVAIAGAETSFATYGPSQKIKNAWGWGPHIEFPTWQASINAIAKGLRTNYLDKGLTTVGQIGAKWAPIGAANDPNGLNNEWSRNVNAVLAELGQQGKVVGPQAAPFVRVPGLNGGSPGSFDRAAARRQGGLNALLDIVRTGDANILKVMNTIADAERSAQQWGGTINPPAGKGGDAYPRSSSKLTNSILAAAHAQIGKPYVWGGETPGEGGFDCSGLIDWAYKVAGIDLPGRLTTQSALKLGRSVKGKKLQPGDLVITNGGQHMVMYVGGGKVISAPHRGEVVQYQDMSRFQGDIVDIRRLL